MATDSIPGLMGMSGYGLVAALCCLIFIEEVGLPMPFAPGDLLLVLAGSAITAGHLNGLVVATAACAAAVLGALCGREVFERLGTRALPRLARFLHVSEQVSRASSRISRGGSVAVFLGRITPGLRICTTQVSGLVKLPRLTFVRGLAPGILVYEAVFLSIGATMGAAAWTTVRQHESPALWVVAGLTAVIAGAALARTVLRKSGMTRPRAPRFETE